MGVFVKLNCLVARVIAGHVAFPAVDAHFGVDECHDMLPVKQIDYRL